jgi:two-component system, cell cycle response regulator
MKILIIDDSPDARAIAKARLGPEGHRIVFAANGAEGLACAAKENPDLILLDVDMPDLSGFEVCRRLKNDPALNAIPVIFVSGSNDIPDKIKGLDLGAVDYVTKPFDAFELRARVRAALRTKRLQDILRDRALIDPLTELANRRAFDDRLGQEWARASRYALRLALIMVDIDHFKNVNDQHGHQVGDETLRQVARRFHMGFRQADLLFRYGGEEFTLLLPETTLASASQLAQRLRLGLCMEPVMVSGTRLDVTASFGVADNENMDKAEQLVAAADESLYQAKFQGRNAVCSTTPAVP